MKNEIVIKALKEHMEKENLEVLCVTETLLSAEKQKEVKEIFKEYDVFISQRKHKKKKVEYRGRGGIMCVARKGSVSIEKKCESDDLMCLNWRGIVLVCAYFVPPTSPYAKTNENRMIEMQQIVLDCKERVLVVTDANGWVGELPSKVTSTAVEGHVSEERVYARRSEKTEVNTQGKWFIDSMNSVDMVVMNGLRSKAQHTYDHLGKEAHSIVDYVAVKESMMGDISDLTYVDNRCILQTDHLMVCVEMKHTQGIKTVKKKAKSKAKKPLMEFLKIVKRSDPFWKSLEKECDNSLGDFNTIAGETLDKDYERFKVKLAEGLTNTLKYTQPHHKLLSSQLKSNYQVVRLRKQKSVMFEKIKKEKDVVKRLVLKKELTKVSNNLKRKTRKAINQFKRDQIEEIENLQVDDCRRMWKELKKLSGWSSKEAISNTVLNERKEEVSGEGVYEVWKEAFRVLGIEDEKDSRFDEEFGQRVTREQEEIYQHSFDESNFNSRLDSPITDKEVVGAVRRLKLGKAAGNDEIVAEILARGRHRVVSAIRILCEKAWEEETLPTEWTRGIIFPIYKDGDKKDTNNYRGITLLSIVGKVYAQVINYRLMIWSEMNKILVEEQGGFRPVRGCPDQLFSLIEILRNRKKTKHTYCCFIDVKKAFDRVFRAGLWKRLAEEGVKGKMWRVLKSIYKTVESCVRIDGNLTDWFPVDTGVRQGCVLSPLLYAFFINGLVKELNELDIGIQVEGGKKVCALLYADDIVMMTENRVELQKMLDVVAKYAKKWRFELNPKKSEVVVFGHKPAPRNIVWKLGDSKIRQVIQYKYLGIELTRTLNYSNYIKRITGKARRNMIQTLAMGIRGGFMTTRLANIMWMSLVRSIIEYGSEVWGEQPVPEFDKLQAQMGKRILRCGSRTSGEVVRGELGWERQIARRDEMR